MKKIIFFIISFFPVSAFAQEYPNPLGPIRSIGDLITNIANTIRPIAVTLGAIAIIVVGFRFVSAAFSGKPEEVTQSRKTLLWVLIGTAIVVAASIVAPAIVDFVRSL